MPHLSTPVHRPGPSGGVLTHGCVHMQDAQKMFDSSMTAAAIAAKVNELQKAAGFNAPLLNPEGTGTSFITLTGNSPPLLWPYWKPAQL